MRWNNSKRLPMINEMHLWDASHAAAFKWDLWLFIGFLEADVFLWLQCILEVTLDNIVYALLDTRVRGFSNLVLNLWCQNSLSTQTKLRMCPLRFNWMYWSLLECFSNLKLIIHTITPEFIAMGWRVHKHFSCKNSDNWQLEWWLCFDGFENVSWLQTGLLFTL